MDKQQMTRAARARGDYNRLCLERGIYVSGEITSAHEALIEAVVTNLGAGSGGAAAGDDQRIAQLEQKVAELAQQVADLAQQLRLYVGTVEVAGDAVDQLTRRIAELEGQVASPAPSPAPTHTAPAVASSFLSGVLPTPATAPAAETAGTTKRRGNGPGR